MSGARPSETGSRASTGPVSRPGPAGFDPARVCLCCQQDGAKACSCPAPQLYRYLNMALGVLARANVAWGGEPAARDALAKARGEP